MKIAIITNGTVVDYSFYAQIIKNYDFIICVDGGLKHAFAMDLAPDIAIGDFDSTPVDILSYYEEKGCEFVRYSSIKDETDTEIALDYAIEKSPKNIDILAGLGSRFDHSLANVHLLKKGIGTNINIKIVTENNEISLIDSSIMLCGNINDGISLIPLEDTVKGIYTTGLGYPITDGAIEIGKPYGVSNYMTAKVAEVTIASGLLLIIRYRD